MSHEEIGTRLTEVIGAAVLAHSLRDSGTSKKLVCMVTQQSLKAETLKELQVWIDSVCLHGQI